MTHYNLNDLTDPQTLQSDNPETVHVIRPYLRKLVDVGHYVRIRRNCEYFWVQVREVNDDNITGEVYYKLGVNPFDIGDTLEFRKCFMFDIYDPRVLNLIPGIDV
ncbi:MAG: hypothetical protein K9L62_10795 [Vallitaleaceae bacterium]|nr:hypothetical protein [Vallitaleaceae bacterium]